MYSKPTADLLHHSLEALQRSTLACFAASTGISVLAHHHARTLTEFGRNQIAGDNTAAPQDWIGHLLDSKLYLAGRDTCLHAAEHINEANVALLDATRSIIEQSQQWMLGHLTQPIPVADEAVAADEVVAEDDVATKPRRRSAAAA